MHQFNPHKGNGEGVVYVSVVFAKSHAVVSWMWQLLFVHCHWIITWASETIKVTASLYLLPVFVRSLSNELLKVGKTNFNAEGVNGYEAGT